MQAVFFHRNFTDYSLGKRLIETINPPQIIINATHIIIIAEVLIFIPPL